MDIWEFGLMQHWMKEIIPRAEQCFLTTNQEKSARQVPIRLYRPTYSLIQSVVYYGRSKPFVTQRISTIFFP